MAADQPNVLLIMSDQHHWRVLGCDGDPLNPTPHLDELASRGVRMRDAHCAFPLCGPSRMAFMTARQPHDIGCLTNTSVLRSDELTWPHAFNEAGYETVIAGRMHFVGFDQQHGFQQRLIGDVAPSVWLKGRGWNLDQVLGPLLSRCTGMGAQVLRVSGPGVQGYQAYDEAVIGAAADWLSHRRTTDRPFMLTVGTVMPHCPFVANPEDFYHFYERIGIDDLPDPRLDCLPPALADLRSRWRLDDNPVDRQTQRVVRAAYYGLVRHLDRLIGRLLAALEQSGLHRNTLVVYTSDHGEQLGEHGLWWKSTFYQGSVGVPMIASLPGRLPENRTVRGNVCLTDLPPTLLDLVGAAPMPTATGRSFRRLLETGSDTDWPDLVRSQSATPSPARMVRRGPWKLMFYDGYEPALFNLDEDPEEMVDLACTPRGRAMVRELLPLVTDDGWDPQAVSRMVHTQGLGYAALRQWAETTSPPEPHPPWFKDRPPTNRLDLIPGSSHRPPQA